MEDVSLTDAKEHLEELVARARKGEYVEIADDKLGKVRLIPVEWTVHPQSPSRLTDYMPPFVPLAQDRPIGRLEGILPKIPDEFFEPMSDEELKDWYGGDE